MKLRRDEVRATGRQTERALKKASKDLGLKKKQALLNARVTTTSLLTEVVTERPAKDVTVILHPDCLAVYKNALQPVPSFRAWLGEGSSCTLCGLPGAYYLLLRGKSRVDATAIDIVIKLRPPAIQPEDGASTNSTVLMTDWHTAIEAERTKSEVAATGGGKSKGGLFGKKAFDLSSIVKRAHEADDDLADDRARSTARAALPGYFKKIIGPYELRVFWFEIFECVRKILLIGLPVFFRPGTTSQLILGLLICFISFGAYMALSPFTDEKHDYVSIICQLQIFFALLAGVMLNSPATEPSERLVMGYILMALQAVPPFFTAFLSSPLSKHVLDKERRRKLFRGLDKLHKKLAPQLELCWAMARRKGKFARAGRATEHQNAIAIFRREEVISTKSAMVAFRFRRRLGRMAGLSKGSLSQRAASAEEATTAQSSPAGFLAAVKTAQDGAGTRSPRFPRGAARYVAPEPDAEAAPEAVPMSPRSPRAPSSIAEEDSNSVGTRRSPNGKKVMPVTDM